MRVVSVDLAYKHYRDFGAVVIDPGASASTYRVVKLPEKAGTPAPGEAAEFLVDLCTYERSTLLMLDGPQAWKAADNGLSHSRLCERSLNTPAKTGLPGRVRPLNYLPFVAFSISLYDELHARGWQRFDPGSWILSQRTVAEVFPLAAWRSLGLVPLPAKRRATPADVQRGVDQLVNLHLVEAGPLTSHDELQALVAGLAGVAMIRGDVGGYRLDGGPPCLLGGHWREGYIVNPRQSDGRQLPILGELE